MKSKLAEEAAHIIKRMKNYASEYGSIYFNGIASLVDVLKYTSYLLLCNRFEKSYWIGKWSLKSWRRLVLENLEHGMYDSNRIGLLSDVHAVGKTKNEDGKKKENAEQSGTDRIVQNGIADDGPVANDCAYNTTCKLVSALGNRNAFGVGVSNKKF